jgi:hypothetical protein
MSSSLSQPWLWWLPVARPSPDPAAAAAASARTLLGHAAAAGLTVPPGLTQPILDMQSALAAGPVPPAVELAFYAAYSDLTKATADISKRPRTARECPFEDAVEDAELLLKHASETGTPVPDGAAPGILAARTALGANALTDEVRTSFYAAYASLSRLFGEVTASTIRNCSSGSTRRKLLRDRCLALIWTVLVAAISVATFVADFNVKKINEDIGIANDLAARLRVGLPTVEDSRANPGLAADPCNDVKTPHEDKAQKVRTLADVGDLQEFAAMTRAVHSRSIKLNGLVKGISFSRFVECSAYAVTCTGNENEEDKDRIGKNGKRLQIYPAIVNYPAEVVCRISTYQEVRDFATNVRENYTSIVGAISSYALPILYALLSAYANRLRLFADTIRQQTYHPSFSDSARMITAIIAGAICGLFNPAMGLALSPLAVAFLVGYGVELFFKLLDTLVNSFGTGGKPAK